MYGDLTLRGMREGFGDVHFDGVFSVFGSLGIGIWDLGMDMLLSSWD